MARDQELISLSSFGKDLLASGLFTSLDARNFADKDIKTPARRNLEVAPGEISPPQLASPAKYIDLPNFSGETYGLEDSPETPEQLIIGGAEVQNVSLVMVDKHGAYHDFKVMPIPVSGAKSGTGSLLVAPVGESKQIAAQPMLLLPAQADSDLSFSDDSKVLPLGELEKAMKESKGDVGVAAVNAMVLSGEIVNFFGVEGVTGKLYCYKSDEEVNDEQGEKPINEKVMLQDMESPLGIFFPEIENKTIKALPLKNLEFTFSNTKKEILLPEGLRLQGDLELKDGLQWISDGLKNVFGSEKATELPSKIRVSALLSKERDWTKKPKIEGIVLQAFLHEMKLPAWDFLEFQTAGIELSARKETAKSDIEEDPEEDNKEGADKRTEEEGDGKSREIIAKKDRASNAPTMKDDATEEKHEKEEKESKEKKKWQVGFGLFGKLNITKAPKSAVPLEARYWIRMGDWKEEKEEEEEEEVEDDDKDKKLEKQDGGEGKETDEADENNGGKEGKPAERGRQYEEAQLHAFFKPGEFRKSCTLSVTGSLEFAQGCLDKDDEEEEEEKKGEKKKEDDKSENATLTIEGVLSRQDYHFDAKVGNLKLDSILKMYAQITGAEPSKEAKEHDLVFEELHLNICRKLKSKEKAIEDEKEAKKEEDEEQPSTSLELSGKVSFNDCKRVHGLIKIDPTSGLTIQGGVEDYEIKDAGVIIKEASIDIFIGAKPEKSQDNSKNTKPKLEADRKSGKEAGEDKVEVFNRASKFAIKGRVNFSGITVTVAFMTERNETNAKSEKSSEREWVLFGIYEESLHLGKMCDIMEGPMADLELKNVALIAASGENKTIEALNTLKYPVRKGISLCATIPPLPELNNFAKQKVDGLVLVATIEKKKLELGIQLPTAFDVSIHAQPDVHLTQIAKSVNQQVTITDSAKLCEIGIGIEISKAPSLMVMGTLNIVMDVDQDPLLLEGMVKAGLLSSSASIATKSPWVNPLNISKHVKIADFRVEIEITYATVMELGPSKLGLAGDIEVGDLTAGAAMQISHHPGEQVISANISKVDLIEIIRVAGQVAEIQALQDIRGGEDTFVFTDANMYFSTGGTIAGREYPQGISAGGKLTAFGKTAQFDLSIGKAGLDFQGHIDNFSLGPLVVSSASGDPRAKMVVVMAKDKQVIQVDGKVRCFGIGLATLVDIQIGTETPSFAAHINVAFTEAFIISLQATVEDFKEVKDLATKDLYFQAQIKGDLFDMICESIKSLLRTLEELGIQGIESLQSLIGAQIAEKQAEMDLEKTKLDEARQEVDNRRKERQRNIKKEKDKHDEAKREIERLQDKVTKAKQDKAQAENELKEKVEKLKLEKESLIQSKRKEYNDKLEKAKEAEANNQRELERLRQRQRDKYGTDFLKKVQLAQGAYHEKKKIGVRLLAAKGVLEAAKVAADVYYKAAQALDDIANSDAFQSIVTAIEDTEKAVERAANGVDKLLSGGGVDGFLRSFIDTEEAKIEAAIKALQAMQNENNEYQRAIREAQDILDQKAPDLEDKIAQADENIKSLEEDAMLADLERKYNYQLEVHNKVHNTIQQMQAGLETLKENWQKGMHALEDVVNEIQKKINAIFHIERIEVGIHTHALIDDKPLVFKFYGTVANRHFAIEAQWAPGNDLSRLYKGVTNEILKLAV
ncbi:hypothetical protein APSETT444_010526 [Aspergillus pseudonomiae]